MREVKVRKRALSNLGNREVPSETLNFLTKTIFSLEMVRVLIDLSPTLNVNCTNKAGWTPLHFAAQYKNLEVRIISY